MQKLFTRWFALALACALMLTAMPALGLAREIDGLDARQLNSINMLNHLVVLTQEINASRNSRLYLEDAYATLINNTSPEAVDSRTLSEIKFLLDMLEGYRMTGVKRERLKYIYEQSRARAMQEAVPNPVGMLSAVRSFSVGSLVASVVYMAVDSKASYDRAMDEAEQTYLQDGWALDDEEARLLHETRRDTFAYMVETVRDYALPGELALNEQAVSDFVEWKNQPNTLQAIQFFEENEDTYRAFGPYWLTLAERYYQNGDYADCLRAVERYSALDMQIFRRDEALARVLPLVIAAAREVQSDTEYVKTARRCVAAILENADNEDWSLRYFAAQTCLELYALTKDVALLSEAYDIALNNVNHLLDKQRELNAAYLAPVAEEKAPSGASKDEKAEIEAYNKLLRAERKAELPPVYEPLLLNCQLLFALADELNVGEEESRRIDGMLHPNGAALFLTSPLDALYWLDSAPEPAREGEVTFSGESLELPAHLLSESAEIVVTVELEGSTTEFSDWTLKKVSRPDANALPSFSAQYSSAAAKDYKFRPGARIHIELRPMPGTVSESHSFDFTAEHAKKLLVFDDVEFVRADA